MKAKLTHTQIILMLLANSPTKCLTFSEIKEKTNLNDNVLYVSLHRLKQRGAISSKWVKTKNGKERIYCLKVKEQLLE